jgi:hypothetical protein
LTLKRKLQLIPRIILLKLTNNKCFICDGCGKIHRRKETDLMLNEQLGVIVSQVCANFTITKVNDLLKQHIVKKMFK